MTWIRTAPVPDPLEWLHEARPRPGSVPHLYWTRTAPIPIRTAPVLDPLQGLYESRPCGQYARLQSRDVAVQLLQQRLHAGHHMLRLHLVKQGDRGILRREGGPCSGFTLSNRGIATSCTGREERGIIILKRGVPVVMPMAPPGENGIMHGS